jgi:uncharacterized membrane protein
MQALIVLLVLYLIAVLLILPIWTIIRVNTQAREHEAQQRRLNRLEGELLELRARGIAAGPAPAPAAPVAPAAPPVVAAAPALLPAEAVFRSAPPPVTPPVPAAAVVAEPPVIVPPPPVRTPAPVRPVYTPPPPQPGWTDNINWEQFMGAKLFAWLGGLALLLGVAFFVKYSFDHGWVPPELRCALGFVFGAGLIVGGVALTRKGYTTPAQTLVGAGVVSLYIVTFACNSIYHFEFFDPVPTFLLMTLITAAAFVLAVSLDAQVIAILGLLGGFLTPVLINTGHDNPAGLFGYLALLDLGLVAVALHRRWFHLVPLAAAGTVLMMIGWAGRFYAPEKAGTAMTVCLGFCALFLGAAEAARRLGRPHAYLTGCAAALPLVSFGFALFFLNDHVVAAQTGLFFGFILLTDAFLLALAWRDEALPRLHLLGGLIVFALLSIWTAEHLTDELLPWALGVYLLFAALHTAFPLLLERRRPAAAPTWWSQLFPPLTLVLMLLPIFKLPEISFLIWPAILLVDVLAIVLALLSASLTAVAVVLGLTLLATGLCILRVPAMSALDGSLLLVIGGFAVFFFAACLWLARKLGDQLPAEEWKRSAVFGDPRAQLPAFASLLPFLLLIMACARLSVPDPSAVFGLGLLLIVLTLGLARLLVIEWLPACALAGMVGLEYAWQGRHFNPAEAGLPLVWHVSFYAVFALYPFLFRREFARLTGPWAVAALSGVVHFALVYRTIRLGWPNDFLGLVPAAFAAAPLASLFFILRTVPADNPKRLNQLAWFGGVALFFITLIFPVQFDRQWLTVAWALEGAALLWLYHRVPHVGLRAVGAILLVVAFVRLGLNGAVLSYHVRGDTALLNWYLYAYGIVAAALFVAARLTAPPRDQVLGVRAPALFQTLAVILLFFLLNIEITDYFTAPGARALAFRFSGDFGRDMTYTIAWALFALGLLAAGLWKQTRPARYAAIALLSVALLKLFLHDLARLEALYRIGALFGVAVIAILASFAYQRFLPSNEKSAPPAP